MDRKLFFTLLAFSFTLLFLYLIYFIIAPFLVPIGWAAVIGISTFPVYERLRMRLHDRRTTAASLVTVAVILTFILPMIGLIFLLSSEAAQAYRVLESIASGDRWGMLDNLQHHPLIAVWLERLKPLIGQFRGLNDAVVSAVRAVISYILTYSGEIAKNFFVFIFKTLLLIITLFFIYRDGDHFQRQFWSVIPLNEARRSLLVDTVKRVLAAVIYGVFLTCLVQGALGGIGFWVVGLPSPLLFGAVMAVCALIPVVGTALIWAPGVIYLMLQGELLRGIVLLVWGVVAVSSIDNFIRPFFISGKARLSVLIIALGALGGLVSFGFLGIVTGPIMLALFIALFDIYRAEIFPGFSPGGESDGKS